MHVDTQLEVLPPSDASPEPKRRTLKAILTAALEWQSSQLARSKSQLTRSQLGCIVAMVFLSALGVRILCWQDQAPELSRSDTLSQNMARQYRREARRILEDRTILFPRATVDPGDARMIIHPPGYSIIMAASFKLFGEAEAPLRSLQIGCDAICAVLVFLIALELLPLSAAIVAALLMSLSPHASYYSLRLSPDSLAMLPILVAVFLIVKGRNQPGIVAAGAAGVMLGVSCWLRPNGLLLPVALAGLILVLSKPGRRIQPASIMLLASFIVISPITIRNWVVYHHFIPLALPLGVNLTQGIAEFDREGRFGMPLSDLDVLTKDVEWNNRPDYGGNMWVPDAIQRDRVRFERGIAVIRSQPIWYVRAMLRRAGFMLSYNESRPRQWPFDTANVPAVSASPPFGRSIPAIVNDTPVWSATPADLLLGGKVLSGRAETLLAEGKEMLRIVGGPPFEDQCISSPVSVRKNTNYVLNLSASTTQGFAAVKVIGPDERVVLGSANLPAQEGFAERKRREKHPDRMVVSSVSQIAFATADVDQVRFVISNNAQIDEQPIVEVGEAHLFEVGMTPSLWTRYPRPLVRGLERAIFSTARLVPLVIAGVILLLILRRRRQLLILLAVPIYYLASHAPFSTEYRYILAIHCFLFMIASVPLYVAGLTILRFGAYLWTVKTRRREIPLPAPYV